MGLDMWFMANTGEVDEDGRKSPREVYYWRKHNALHNWFTQRAIRDGIVKTAREFNCVSLPLTYEVLDELEKDVVGGNLEPVDGLFFGGTDYDPRDDIPEDLEAIAKARDALGNGFPVYYTSWW